MTNPKQDDFDSFLSQATEAQERKDEGARYMAALDERFNVAAEAAGLERFLHSDPEIEESIRNGAVLQSQQIILETQECPEDLTTEEFEEIARMRAETIVAKVVMEEEAITAWAKILIGSYEYSYLHDENFDPEKHAKGKMRLFANMIVDMEYAPDDPWFAFLNAMIPGDLVDIESPEFQEEMFEAMEVYANSQEEKENTSRQLAELKALIENGEIVDDERAVKIMRVAGRSIVIAFTEHKKPERESQIREICRTIALDEQLVVKALDYLNSEYPLQ